MCSFLPRKTRNRLLYLKKTISRHRHRDNLQIRCVWRFYPQVDHYSENRSTHTFENTSRNTTLRTKKYPHVPDLPPRLEWLPRLNEQLLSCGICGHPFKPPRCGFIHRQSCNAKNKNPLGFPRLVSNLVGGEENRR